MKTEPHIQEGVLVDTELRTLVGQHKDACICTDPALIQPASIDLEIGDKIWEINNDPPLFQGFNSKQFLEHYKLNTYSLAAGPVVLRINCAYLVELDVEFKLPKDISGCVNPKSSTGRIDIFSRVLAEGSLQYDQIPAGYTGKLYALLVPRSFPVKLHKGQSLQQMRLVRGTPKNLSHADLVKAGLITNTEAVIEKHEVILHLDLGKTPSNLVANRAAKVLDIQERRSLDAAPFFRVKTLDRVGNHKVIILDPGDFILCSTRETLRIPAGICMEMQAIDTGLGQYASHAAGFFDPGFGGKDGQTAVCEITNFGTVPIALADGQRICKMTAQFLGGVPGRLYGEVSSTVKEQTHYAKNNLLAKYFTPLE